MLSFTGFIRPTHLGFARLSSLGFPPFIENAAGRVLTHPWFSTALPRRRNAKIFGQSAFYLEALGSFLSKIVPSGYNPPLVLHRKMEGFRAFQLHGVRACQPAAFQKTAYASLQLLQVFKQSERQAVHDRHARCEHVHGYAWPAGVLADTTLQHVVTL